MRFKIAGGEVAAGKDLKRILQLAKGVKQSLDPIVERMGNQAVVEQTAAADGFNPDNRSQKTADAIAKRLDNVSPVYEKGWAGLVLENGGYAFTRTVRGVETRYELSAAHLNSHEGQRLAKTSELFIEFFNGTGSLQGGEKEVPVYGPFDLYTKVIEGAKKGLAIQRYKGLGEMNPEQLWETTLDPNIRSLLQVKIEKEDMASEIFSTLMGDIVEPRRDFIQEHALEVSNLDV